MSQVESTFFKRFSCGGVGSFFFFFWLFSAARETYGSSQARGIRAIAAGLQHSYSNARSEPHLYQSL